MAWLVGLVLINASPPPPKLYVHQPGLWCPLPLCCTHLPSHTWLIVPDWFQQFLRSPLPFIVACWIVYNQGHWHLSSRLMPNSSTELSFARLSFRSTMRNLSLVGHIFARNYVLLNLIIFFQRNSEGLFSVIRRNGIKLAKAVVGNHTIV